MKHVSKDLRFGSRIFIGNLLMLLLLAMVAVSGYSGLQLVAQSNDIVTQRRSEMADIRMLQLYIKNMYAYQADYIINGDPVSSQGFRNTITPLKTFREKIRQTIDTEDERLNLNIIDRQTDEFIDLFLNQIIPARQQDDLNALDKLDDQSRELIAQMDPFIQNMIADYEKRADDASQAAQNTRTQTILIVISLSVLAGLIGIVSGIIQARTISKSARQIVQASEKVRKSEAALKESERFLENIIENIPHFIFVKDARDLSYIKLNRAGEVFWGYPRENLVGKNDFEFITHEQAMIHLAQDQEVLQTRQPVDVPEEILISKDLGPRSVHTKKLPILDDNGQPQYILGIAEDITDRKKNEDEIRQLNLELEQRVSQRTAQLELTNHELESFAYSISHDLRAPLRAIEGYSHILLDEYQPQLDADGQQYLNRIRANTRRMAQLIEDLLDLSRVTRHTLNLERVDLCFLAQTSINFLKEFQPERRVEFILPENIYVWADARLMQIVIDNLFNNAWKFTNKCEHARIELGLLDKSGQNIYYVRDNGAGFDMAYLHNLFKPFHRLHSVEEFEGTGIGLAMVQRVIQRHGGQIWAEGAVGQGATFYFTLEN